MKSLFTLIILSATLLSCGGSNSEFDDLDFDSLPTTVSYSSKTIKAEEYGEEWPFTVDEGILKCDGEAVTFVTDGKIYPINGLAGNKTHLQLEDIWRVDEKAIESYKEMGISEKDLGYTPRISISGMINEGLELCQ